MYPHILQSWGISKLSTARREVHKRLCARKTKGIPTTTPLQQALEPAGTDQTGLRGEQWYSYKITHTAAEFQTKTQLFTFSETVVMDQLSELSVSDYHNAVVLHKGCYPLSPEPKRNHFSTQHNSGKNSSSKPNLGKEGTALNFEAVLGSVLFPLLLLRWKGQKQGPVKPPPTSIIKDTHGQG